MSHIHTQVSRQILLRRKLQLHLFFLIVNDMLSLSQKKMGEQNKSGKAAVTKRASCNEYATRTCSETLIGLDTLQSVQNSTKFRCRHSDDDFKTGGHFDSWCNDMRKFEIGTVG
jgi:hypothetical protein